MFAGIAFDSSDQTDGASPEVGSFGRNLALT